MLYATRVGECAMRIRRDFDYSTRYPEMKLDKIVACRNKMVHEYYRFDEKLLYDAVKSEYSGLADRLDSLIAQLQPKVSEEDAQPPSVNERLVQYLRSVSSPSERT